GTRDVRGLVLDRGHHGRTGATRQPWVAEEGRHGPCCSGRRGDADWGCRTSSRLADARRAPASGSV
ncbi:MAG: hypothetical protein AVDCRST_MAG29-353, partial [uncultured Nocardioidaceae bacterium]